MTETTTAELSPREVFQAKSAERDQAKAKYQQLRAERDRARREAQESLDRHRQVLSQRILSENACDDAWRHYRALERETEEAWRAFREDPR